MTAATAPKLKAAEAIQLAERQEKSLLRARKQVKELKIELDQARTQIEELEAQIEQLQRRVEK